MISPAKMKNGIARNENTVIPETRHASEDDGHRQSLVQDRHDGGEADRERDRHSQDQEQEKDDG